MSLLELEDRQGYLAATGQQLFMNFKLLQNDVFFGGAISLYRPSYPLE